MLFPVVTHALLRSPSSFAVLYKVIVLDGIAECLRFECGRQMNLRLGRSSLSFAEVPTAKPPISPSASSTIDQRHESHLFPPFSCSSSCSIDIGSSITLSSIYLFSLFIQRLPHHSQASLSSSSFSPNCSTQSIPLRTK